MHRKSIALVIAFILSFNLFRFSPCEASSGKGSGTIATISITSGVVIGGTALFFIIRNKVRTNRDANISIDFIDSLWGQVHTSYNQGLYPETVRIVEQIQLYWNPFINALAKKREPTVITKDSLLSIIHLCSVHQKLQPSINTLNRIKARLPTNQDQLLKWNRHTLLATLDTILNTINDSLLVYKNDQATVTGIYEPMISATRKVDTLFLETYNSERLNFALKNRFYYNRMVETNTQAALKMFVDDCDYYKVDKEFCERARLTLQTHENSEHPSASDIRKTAQPNRKPTAIDIMNESFISAITSRNIEQLEHYLKKYSVKQYRKVARLDSVRLVLESTRRELLAEQMFTREHPRFSEVSTSQLTISIKGLQQNAESEFRKTINSLNPEIDMITSMRYPATLSIDYSSTPPLFLLSGYIHGKKDITRTDSLKERRYTITGAQEAFILLDKLARLCSVTLKNLGVPQSYSPAYAVRLIKNGETYLTLYGSGKNNTGIDFYTFYDISIPGYQNIRIPYKPDNFTITLSENSDSLQQHIGIVFFEK